MLMTASSQSTRIVNAIYGVDAPVLLPTKNGDVQTLWSSQGSRQGCALGTESFCYAIDGPVRRTHAMFPDFVFKVLTDDIVVMCPPPRDGSEAGWAHDGAIRKYDGPPVGRTCHHRTLIQQEQRRPPAATKLSPCLRESH